MSDGDEQGPRIPIPGVEGVKVFGVLHALALHAGEADVVIRKRRAAGGGYVYSVSKTQPPAEPVIHHHRRHSP